MSSNNESNINGAEQQAVTASLENNRSQKSESATLAGCAPLTHQRTSDPRTLSKSITRPRRDEPFTTVADPIIVACVVDRKRARFSQQASEEYYPVTRELQQQAGTGLRSVAFHPCVNASGNTFIYPQKLDPPHAWPNTWNASLAQALSLPTGQWRTVWSDKEAECYQHELVEPPMESTPEYPNFREDLEQALTPNIIATIDHPVLQQILCRQDADIDNEEIYS